MDLDNRQDGLVHGQQANASVSSRQNTSTEANHTSSGESAATTTTTSSATHTHTAPLDDNGTRPILFCFLRI